LLTLSEFSRFTNKVDIFGIGCIFFELVFCKKAFQDDYYIGRYAENPGEELTIPESSDIFLDEETRGLISKEIHRMLQIDPSQRPRAKELHMRFQIETTKPFIESSSDSPPEVDADMTVSLRQGQNFIATRLTISGFFKPKT
jgi:serine/threonine protein kinase